MKNFLIGSMLVFSFIFGVFGIANISNAQISTISAGTSQTITLPTSSVILSGSAVPSNGNLVTSYDWVQTSGPKMSTITTPTFASTIVTGLTMAGTYVFTLTAKDNTTPVALMQSATVSVVVLPNTSVNVTISNTQDIKLPTTVSSLTGAATTPTIGSAIASYNWTQVSGPVNAVIATPFASSTALSGLTTAGEYVFKLTATDTTTPNPLSGSAMTTIKVKSQDSSSIHTNKKFKSKLEINGNGSANLVGELTAISDGMLSVKVWGIMFSVKTSNLGYAGSPANISRYMIGDTIRVNGSIDPTATTPTITARSIQNLSFQSNKMMKENKGKGKDKMKDNWNDNKQDDDHDDDKN